MSLPTFLLLGAMKSGTSSLYRYLGDHPDIFVSSNKEPGFFVEQLTWNNGWEWYERLFDRATCTRAIGEGSTHYTKYPTYDRVAEKIAQHLPNAKLIYIMREPVARTASHYLHMVHRRQESRPMLRAIKQRRHYIDVGRYAMQLEQYFKFYPREQFYFATFERLKSSPRDVVCECFRFLGVDDTFVPAVLGKAFNEGPAQMCKPRGLIHRLRWSPWWSSVAPHVPQGFKNFAKTLEYTTVDRPRTTPRRVSAYLDSIFAEENERLFEMIGMRFEEWESPVR
jgi:hypothetical protein